MQTVKNVYRIEYLLLVVILSLFYVEIKGDWYFFFGVFFVFDVGAIGYLFSKKIGDIFYDFGHNTDYSVVIIDSMSVEFNCRK